MLLLPRFLAHRRQRLLAVLAATALLATACSAAEPAPEVAAVVEEPDDVASPQPIDESVVDDDADPAASDSLASPGNPVPLGETGRVLWERPVQPIDWAVTVTGVTENPDGLDMDAAPIDGRTPVLIDIEVTNNTDRREVISTLSFGAADDTTEYTGLDECGPSIPNSIPTNPLNIEPGETVQRAVCYQVDPDQRDTRTLWAEPNGLNDLLVWFDLR